MSDEPNRTDMPGIPRAPTNPETASAFREAVTSNADEWFAYIRTMDQSMRNAATQYDAIRRQLETMRTNAEKQRLRGEGALEALREELRNRSTDAARLSEKLPDPNPFSGDRKDLRRFENA
ncbi:hypothetical protein SEPCBS119000_006763, partial [Sporothrix epigloea]